VELYVARIKLTRSRQDTEIKQEIRHLHSALIDLVGVVNRPQPDAVLIKEAGISLDRALFPLLVGVERRGPIGVVELADRVGRDYTTVSRQVSKLEMLGLVKRRASDVDARVREAVITDQGKRMTRAIDTAREKLAAPILATWTHKDRQDLIRLMRRFADDLMAWPSLPDRRNRK
jgi:DNA-binding MarR family transcriptional regulator